MNNPLRTRTGESTDVSLSTGSCTKFLIILTVKIFACYYFYCICNFVHLFICDGQTYRSILGNRKCDSSAGSHFTVYIKMLIIFAVGIVARYRFDIICHLCIYLMNSTYPSVEIKLPDVIARHKE